MAREISLLNGLILALGATVEENVHKAVQAFETRNTELAETIIAADADINEREVELEEECLKALALHQPVAIDLRFIVAVLKINNDLERIADLAVNIAERAVSLSRREPVTLPFDFSRMVTVTKTMLRQSLDALVEMDTARAHEVLMADDEVDRINREMYGQVAQRMREHPEQLESCLHYLTTSRYLERIADHATNIAEDVIYMVDGEIVRHHAREHRIAQQATRPA
jgi:phosphate transport system protein